MTTIITHNAKFHSDDVFAVATLLLVYPEAKVIRTRDDEEIKKADIVVDVGGIYDERSMRFDHHQLAGAGQRPNGIEYSSFGLIWKKFGVELIGSQEAAAFFDQVLVQSIDAGDNGINTFDLVIPDASPYLIGGIVDLYRGTWKEEDDWDERFSECVKWAQWMLKRQIKVIQDEVEARNIIREIYKKTENKSLIIVDEQYDFGREVVNGVLIDYPEPVYSILYRADHHNWQLVSVRKEHGSFNMRKPLPESWRAKSGDEFSTASGVEGSFFCHRSGFMCVVKSKEGAVKLAQIALNA